MAAGSLGGLTYWLGTYHIDVVKSAIQADSIHPAERTYRSIAGTFAKLYAEGGIGRFYKGFTPCILRSVPANAVCFTGYELTVKYLRGEL